MVDLVENTEMWEIQGAATYNERANVCQPCTSHKKDNVYTQYVVCSSLSWLYHINISSNKQLLVDNSKL